MARSLAAGPLRLLGVLLLTGCIDLGGAAPDAAPIPDASELSGDGGKVVEVTIFGLAFSPRSITIRAGTTVRWTNLDAVPHTVTEGAPAASGTPIWDSPMLGAGDTFQWTFTERGEWTYYCRTHPYIMRDNLVKVQ